MQRQKKAAWHSLTMAQILPFDLVSLHHVEALLEATTIHPTRTHGRTSG
jgi:hypothetical protein